MSVRQIISLCFFVTCSRSIGSKYKPFICQKYRFLRANINFCLGQAWWLTPIITLGVRGGWITRSRDGDHPGQQGETISTKNTKISWAWWCAPVVPATREAEAGDLLEPRRRRLQWAEIRPLYKTPSQKKKKKSSCVEKCVTFDLTFKCI